jgi:hypothetical protein
MKRKEEREMIKKEERKKRKREMRKKTGKKRIAAIKTKSERS